MLLGNDSGHDTIDIGEGNVDIRQPHLEGPCVHHFLNTVTTRDLEKEMIIFPPLGLWSVNFSLIFPFPDRCLLFYIFRIIINILLGILILFVLCLGV